MDFSSGAGLAGNNDCIPNGTLLWVILNVRGVKPSNSGGQYVDIELTIDDTPGQPYSRKKLWDMIGDPFFQGNSEAYRQMGMIAITRILEAGRGAGPNNKAGYNLTDYQQLNGLRVPVKVGIEKGTGGHDDKNRVAEWLTPNPDSKSGHKHYTTIMSGVFTSVAKSATPAAANGFGAPAATSAPTNQPGFGGAAQPGFTTPPATAAAPAASQWGKPAETAASPSDSTTQAGTVAPAETALTPSPSDQPAWLKQANAGA